MKRLGLIGGTGLDRWGSVVASHPANSVYGPPSAAPAEYQIGTTRVFFLPRHGQQHQIPPHAVNYRANIDVLKQLGVEGIVAVNAVGGISSHGHPGALVVPDQLIDDISLVGPADRIRDRLQAWKEAGKKGHVGSMLIGGGGPALRILAEELL